MIPLSYYLVLSFILFIVGLLGLIINHKNLIIWLMSIELLLLAVNTNLIAFSYYFNDLSGQIMVLFILTAAAAETAIALAILVVLFNHRRTIEVDQLDTLKG